MSEPEYWARPKHAAGSTSLRKHLNETKSAIRELTQNETTLSDVAETAALLHDFGKLTEWFQAYIRRVAITDQASSRLTQQERRRKQHARLSAYAVEYALYKRDISPDWRVAAFVAVAKHHQSLPDTDKVLDRTTNLSREVNQQRFTLVQDQLKNIYETAPQAADLLFEEATAGTGSLEDFVAYVHAKRTHETLANYESDADTYANLLHLWGLLTAADKLASAGLGAESTATSTLPPTEIDERIRQLPSGESRLQQQLNQRREAARQEVLDNIHDLDEAETNIATITLPTGFGKTLTGLQAALRLANPDSRVIYALPYTSIIDQVDETIRTVFDVSPTDPEYTIHHHLAETRTIPSEKLVDTDTTELLAKTWQAPLVLTTFVQLFESLAGPTNRQSVKLPAFENAVVVLDEPQALPKKWWHFVAWSISVLVEEFDAKIIFMTATQPQLLRQLPYVSDPQSLVEDTDSHFEFLADNPRVQHQLDQSVRSYLDTPRTATPLSLDAAVSQIASDGATNVLTIGNTVASVAEMGEALLSRRSNSQSLNHLLQELYQAESSAEALIDQLTTTLTEQALNHQGPIVSTLTSRLRPIDRLILLNAIRRLLESDTRLYVASTQLVEAGVDVSFDRLYRDFAPLPSLIQAAGRCNREFGGETADVTIWRLSSPERGIPPSDLIYAEQYDLLSPTRETLQAIHSDGVISEYEMAQNGATRYFETLHESTRPGDRSLVEDGQRAKFGSLQGQSLIPDEYEQVDIYIAVTANELGLIDAYTRLKEAGKHDRVRNLGNVLQQRQISMPDSHEYLAGLELVPFTNRDSMYYLDATGESGEYQLAAGGKLGTQ